MTHFRSYIYFSILLTGLHAGAQQPYWEEIQQQGDQPTAVWGAAMGQADKTAGVAYRFGGLVDVFPNDFTVNDFYEFNLETGTWTQLPSQHPASADAMIMNGHCPHCVTIVGGRGRFRTGNDHMFPEMTSFKSTSVRWNTEYVEDPFLIRRASTTVVEVPNGPSLQHRDYYMFGGVGNTLSGFPKTPTGLRNDVVVYNAIDGWSTVETYGDQPVPRAWSASVYNPKTHSILLFGGYRLGFDQGPDTPPWLLFGPTNFENDLWSLDLDTMTWSQIHPDSALPPTRDNVRGFMDVERQELVIFGGNRHDGTLNDIWTWSYATNEWQEIVLPTMAPKPAGRVGPASFVHETETTYEFYIHGGATGDGTGDILDDMWRLTWPKQQ